MYQNQAKQPRSEKQIYTKESVVDTKKIKLKKILLKELYLQKRRTIGELSQTINLSIPSTTGLIDELVAEEWMIETGLAFSKQGRRPAIYELNQKKNFTLVIDMNYQETNFFIVSLNSEIIHTGTTILSIENNPNFIDILLLQLSNFFIQKGIIHSHILAIGLILPNTILQTGNKSDHHGINTSTIHQHISNHFNVPLYTLNHSRASAYGEFRLGSGKCKKHLLSLNADEGLSMGIVINGEIFGGATGFAGELGHIQINPEGELCTCGKNGCLNTLTFEPTLHKIIQKRLENGQNSKLNNLQDNGVKISIEKIIAFAQQGDIFSIDLLHFIGLEIGKGLAVAVQMFNPEMIIIGGVLSKAKKLITNPIEHSIQKFCTAELKEGLLIEVSELGDISKVLGIHAYTTEHILSIE